MCLEPVVEPSPQVLYEVETVRDLRHCTAQTVIFFQPGPANTCQRPPPAPPWHPGTARPNELDQKCEIVAVGDDRHRVHGFAQVLDGGAEDRSRMPTACWR